MKFWIGLISILISFSALVYAGMYWWNIQLTPVNINNKSEQTLVIANNESANVILQKLVNQKLIRSLLGSQIIFTGSWSGSEIEAWKLFTNSITISIRNIQNSYFWSKRCLGHYSEGFRREQIAQKFANFELFDANEFLSLTASSEGRLFPDTYLVPLQANAKDVISMMSKNFGNRVGEISHENLILASLVEREVQ